ncbi:hypothetical protein AQUCO_13300033v1 [Aquilegia coerulea]|uniref:Pentacotripeptide-repeat region of PRORP domain-containing protein n=1 Tax=Aquilegia coerulea TaxID=218851 RepID=A0A2G5C190_AQUCA|nr:hypothetical protein AQUCO_13300033v1 [Aquilegia coerulea]
MKRVSTTMLRLCNRTSKSNDILATHILSQNFTSSVGEKPQPQYDFQMDTKTQNPPIVSSSDMEKNRGSSFICLEDKPHVHHTHQVNIDEYSADVEKIYRILRKFHSRAPKLELALQESGVAVSSGLVERVLSRCGDAGNLGYRFFAWASKQPGYRHNYQVYKSIIKILGKMRQFGAVWALIEEMRKENPELLTADAFIVLMRRFASARMVMKAIEVLDEMPKYGCEPDVMVVWIKNILLENDAFSARSLFALLENH